KPGPPPGAPGLAGPPATPPPGPPRRGPPPRRRTRTAAPLLCRAAATPCPAYDPCGLSLIYLPLLLKFYRQVEDT
ncbi:hypothetical protein, partial [Klebsiella pneumoniae]|uniref:hypothetical protein n=1 Tax=Klebsiella pneumoniae TaxID=573 RepID=UPI002361E436